MRLRWGTYAGVSTALAGGVIIKALAQRPNFYSAAVYLSQSSANLMILTNFIFVTACAFLLFLQRFLYGPLRPIEIEQLYEKAWFAVTETCLAMTIFRGEIGAWFLVMFFALLVGKVWGWIGEGRVEILEQQPPQNPRLFHTRLAASLILSVLFDTYMLEYVVQEVLQMARPDMMVMFGFEFAVLSILSLSTLARYGISLVEILIVRGQKYRRVEEIRKERREAREARLREQSRRIEDEQPATEGQTQTSRSGETSTTDTTPVPDEPVDESEIEVEGWEEKGRWIFYLDLTTDFFKLVIYLSFFFILLIFYGLPIHIMRDVFLTCRSFFKRIADFLRYRTATRDMDERYPDATAEDIGREDVCIICREEMRATPRTDRNTATGGTPGQQQDPQGPQRSRRMTNPVADRMRPKKLPCGHVLHFSCLRSWLERQQICPTCRRPVLPTHRIQVGGPAIAGGRAGFLQGVQEGMVAGRGEQQGQHHDPPDDQQRGAGNQNRARIFQFGPLRIGVGAGRGNMFEDLAQRIRDGDVDPIQNQGAANANAPQQYGLGFGLGRPRTRERHRHTPSTAGGVEAQLDQAERQIQQEINHLRLATSELNVVRMLQAELTRLRALRHGSSTTTGTSTSPSTALAMAQTTAATATGFVADARQNVLEAGNEGLPQGLTLPQGWSMMPLQRMQPGTQLPPMGVGQAIGPGVAMPPPMLPFAQGFGMIHGPQPLPVPNFGPALNGDQALQTTAQNEQQGLINQPHQEQQRTQQTQEQAASAPPQQPATRTGVSAPAVNGSSQPSHETTAGVDDDVRRMFTEATNMHEEALRRHAEIHAAQHANSLLSNGDDTGHGTLASSQGSPPGQMNGATNPLPPTASFSTSLPLWGSGLNTAIPATALRNGEAQSHSDQQSVRRSNSTSNGAASSTSRPARGDRNDDDTASDGHDDQDSSSQTSKRYAATVEDLVEDPD